MDGWDFDPALFGSWPMRPVYDGLRRLDDGGETALLPVLDRKAGDVPAAVELIDMLNGMTRELREQMQTFQMLRQQADRRAAEAGDEIDRKLVQADAKAAIEAMSLIVRTLEKIDSLQRTLAQDRAEREEEMLDEADYQALLARIETLIDQRAEERAGERAAVRDDGRAISASAADAGGIAAGRGPPPGEGGAAAD